MRNFILLFIALLMLNGLTGYGQTGGKISGKVINSNDGAPLSGVTILIKGTNSSAVTGNDGTFNIASKQANPTLLLSSIGFNSKSVKVSGDNVSISMDADIKSISEIVVTGVGPATSRKKLGISVESVVTDRTTPVPTASIDQFLIGKIAGAQITSANGSPGAKVNILLRGINSLRKGTSPMILLDGLEVGGTDLNSLDLTNIERVEVVQGAASATLYGAQGANGVIQLFSKKGKQGKINIDLSSSVSSNELLNLGNVHKANFHSLTTNANNQVVGAGNVPLVFDSNYAYKTNVIWNSLDPLNNNNKAYDQNLKYYDHYKMFFQKSYTYNNAIAISGGRDKMDFNVSASDNRQTSNFKNNGEYSRSNFNGNLGVEIFKNLKFRSNTQLVYTKSTLKDATGRTILYALNNSRPFANYDYQTSDGDYLAYYGGAVGVNGYNPNYQSKYAQLKENKIDVIQNFNLNYKFPKFLELDTKYGINYGTDDIQQNILDQSRNLNADYYQYWVEGYTPYVLANYGNPSTKDETGEIDNYNFKDVFQNFLSTATIRTDFQKDFHLKIPLKTSTQVIFDYRKNVRSTYITYGIDAPAYTPYTAAQMGTYKIQQDTKTPFVTYGYVFSQGFEYADVAGITGLLRSDYSSAFGRGSKPFNFPSGNIWIRPSQLNFWKNGNLSNVISEFKLRAAYGQAGIQPGPFDRYVTLNTRNFGSNTAFVFPTSNPNPDLQVEVSKEFEVGTDLSFNVFKNNWLKNINFSITYWDRKSDKTIYNVDAAPSTGIGTLLDNAFGLGSNGIQASLNANVYNSRNLNWNMTVNFSKESSKITSIIGKDIPVTSAAGSTNYVLKAGEKIGQLYGYLGLHRVDELKADGTPYIPKTDQGLYEVASNGWVVTTATKQPYFTPDQYSFGDPNPKFNMSFINDVTFKNFLYFSMQWDWVNGSHLYNQTKEWMYRDGISGDYDKPITIAGTTGAWSAFYRGVYAQRSRNGTKNYFYENSSFGRLRNISLAFDVAKFVHVPGFQRLQLVLSGRNLITITKYTGYDPEVNSGQANSAFDRGVDHNTIPNVKSYQVGLNVGF